MVSSAARDTLELIRNRRSVRRFSGQAIPREFIDLIVESGLCAPSSKNSNPWFFVTVTGTEKAQVVTWLQEAAASSAGQNERRPMDPVTGLAHPTTSDTVDESAQSIAEADTLILLFNRGPFSHGVESVKTLLRGAEVSESRLGQGLYVYTGEILALGASVQNMLLASAALGLGAVYIADAYPARRVIAAALKSPWELVGMIAIGAPAEQLPRRTVRRDLVAAWNEAADAMSRLHGEQRNH